ncbi:hypothetical protein PTR15_24155 [Serratia nevei]|uniref:MrpH family fimbial adhesin n=1 Tax=Serratia nevei TaxID=2703794 RepID=UPI00313CBA89
MKKLCDVFLKETRFLAFNLLLLSGHSYGALYVDFIWEPLVGSYYIGTLQPTGTVDNLYISDGLRCFDGPCEAKWEIITDGMKSGCFGKVISPTGTLYNNHVNAMNNTMIKPCPTQLKEFTGNEKMCVRLISYGEFISQSLRTFNIVHLTSGGECGPATDGGQTIPPVTPPVKPTSCSINDDIYLRHGNVNYDSINENRVSASAYLSCSRTSTIKVSIGNGGVIDLNAKSGLKSTIYISGKKGVNAFKSVNGMSVLFESVLTKTGGEVVGGNFSNSAVVTLDIL